YRYGRGELGTYGSCGSSHCARLALALPMQKYLFGLGEVPSSWPAAVLRAQAIAGRTYAYEKSLRYDPSERSCGCHVYDSTIDQAYIGDSKRVGSAQYWTDWKSAVKATNQTVIMHGGSPIQALYSSSSGGHTENNENVWGGAPIPYLRGVADKADKAGGANPNFKWTVTMSWSEFASKLQAAYKVGEVQDFELVKPFGVSGRVTVVKSATSGGARITGSSGVEHTSGWSVRSALSLRDTLFRVDIGQPVGKVFRPLYRRLDGAPGDPTSPVYQVPRGTSKTKGRAQDFTKGRMTRNHALDKSVWQWGKVLKKYDGLGRERSKLGMPTSSIWGPGDFRGGTYKNGRIVWSDAFGAHPIVARFAKAFVRVGGVKGALGVPRGHRKARASIPDGRLQRFRNGTLYEPKKGGEVFALWGSIDERYRKMGAATSRCGPPTSDVAKEGERSRASFRDGVISWTEATGVEVDCGA
ncbi:MAG TPA: SpoIID/LytB domain-containing protein, partial [Actinomycetota bacterium]|nr:SpoIID/LytB domain-containing protein [Actinomycetota bacterium]